MLFAWRDYLPTFTDASLIAAGTGALLWAVLATGASPARRTGGGLAGFIALEVATFGGPLKSGYRPGEITFSLSAVPPNLRYMPAHLIEAMPMLVLGLAGLGWIAGRWARLRRAGGEHAAGARRDLAVGLALAASWSSVWGLYAAYTWTAHPGGGTLQVVRFYVPALGAIALLGAWLLVQIGTRLAARARPAPLALTSAALVMAMFGLGAWSFTTMRDFSLGGITVVHGGRPGQPPPGESPGGPGPGRQARGGS